MKRLITMIAMAAALMSCATSEEQKAMEEVLSAGLNVPSSYKCKSFELTDEVTLADEVADRLEYFQERASYGLPDIDGVIELLNGIKEQYPDKYNEVTFREYTLNYEAKNVLGVRLPGVCVGRFNADGELVAVKSDNESWMLLGDFFSIPGYKELLDR